MTPLKTTAWEAMETRLLTDTARTHILMSPDPEYCLLLHYEFTGLVKLDQVISQLPANANVSTRRSRSAK